MITSARGAPAPQLYRWSRDDYYRLGEIGLFDGRHVQLIEGDVIEMPPIGPEHSTAATRTVRSLRSVFQEQYLERIQQPLDLGPMSQPEPDVAFVLGDLDDFADHHPTMAALVVEIANSSLGFDRTEKASLYARAGIPDYWIVNLVERQLEVYRDPMPDDAQPFRFGYRTVLQLNRSESIAPLAFPDSPIAVASLFRSENSSPPDSRYAAG